jgi:hypothetical protein
VKKIRKRLTYANVMSSIAVFLVIGGATAFAALGKNTVGTKQLKSNAVTAAKIKNNAVTTNKIKKSAVNGAKVKDGSLTGADINLGTLGTVPSAANANTVGGNSVVLINYQASPVGAPTQILNLDGFTLTASCNAGDKTVVLANGPTGSRLQSSGQDSFSPAENKDGVTTDTLTPTSNIDLLEEDHDQVVGNTQFSLGNGGRPVSVVWEAEGFNLPGPHCTFTGYAIG